jgi:hypothetical protein
VGHEDGRDGLFFVTRGKASAFVTSFLENMAPFINSPLQNRRSISTVLNGVTLLFEGYQSGCASFFLVFA